MNKEQIKSKCEPCIDEKHNLCWEGDLMLHCNCSCHQPTNRIREEWRERLQVEVMEDYIMDSEMSPGELKNQYMREHFEKLINFIDELLKSQREELVEKIEAYIKTNKGINPLPTIEESVARDIIKTITDK